MKKFPNKSPRFLNTFQPICFRNYQHPNLLMNLSLWKSRKVLNIIFLLITVVISYLSDMDLPQMTNKSETICQHAYVCTPIISSQSVFKQLCIYAGLNSKLTEQTSPHIYIYCTDNRCSYTFMNTISKGINQERTRKVSCLVLFHGHKLISPK